MIVSTQIVKSFFRGDIETPVLKGIDLTIQDGEFVSIMGRSGAGKSTLLYQLGLLDHPTSGEIIINKTKTSTLSSTERTNFRLRNMGFVFQDYALLPELTAAENVMMPLLMLKYSKAEALLIAKEALAQVGLEHRLKNLPSQLSGGEQQRISVARAYVHNPKIIFADEPTASLDAKNAMDVINIFKDLNKKGQTIVMVTHEDIYAKHSKRIITLSEGVIHTDKQIKQSTKKSSTKKRST